MNRRYIAVGLGYWGAGNSIFEACTNLRKSGGKLSKPFNIHEFKSELSFAPTNREAKDTEADCWCGQDGSINWVRCERIEHP